MNKRKVLIGGGAAVALGVGATWLAASSLGSSSDYEAGIAPLRAPLADPAQARDLIRYATLAANGHNTQPWKFRVGEQRIDILPDFSRRTPVVDPDDHHLFVSLGCAAENLSIASAARGRPGEVVFDPAGRGSVGFISTPGRANASALFDAIAKRQSTRGDYDGRPVSVADLRTLAAAGSRPGVDLVLLTDHPRLERLRDLVVAGNNVQMADAAFLRELKVWLRFNPRRALRTGDGLYAAASGSPSVPDWLGPVLFGQVATAKSEGDRYAGQMRSSSGAAIFVGARDDPAHWVLVGQACQRFALQATTLGLKLAFVNQPVEVAAMRADLASLVGLAGRRPDIVMRFGYGPALPYSPRRLVDETILA